MSERTQFMFFLVLSLLLGTSCLSNQQTVMLQDGPYKSGEMTLEANKVPQYRLQPNDVLSIKVKSTSKDNVENLNVQPDGVMNINAVATFLNGYNIDNEGMIVLPSVGSVKLAGLTMSEARKAVEEKIRLQAPKATVFVTLVSFKVSIIGEVRKPGYYYVYNNQLNVLEALAQAGDLDDYADRTRVHLIRQTPEGSNVTLLNLTKPDIIRSPYFYLQPSDVLYVPPLEVKNNRHNLANMTVINILLTGVTTTIAVISLINNNRRYNEGG